MHCSYNHSALLEFDFDPLKAGAKPRVATEQHRWALASSGTGTQMCSIQMGLTAPAPEAWCQEDMERKPLYHSHAHSYKTMVKSVKEQNKWRQYFKRCHFKGSSVDTGCNLTLYLTRCGRMGRINLGRIESNASGAITASFED